MYETVKTINGLTIDRFGNGYTVFFEGDELYFDTVEEAEEFIKSVE